MKTTHVCIAVAALIAVSSAPDRAYAGTAADAGGGPDLIDATIQLALPAAMPVGQAAGLSFGWHSGDRFEYGVRLGAGWASESNLNWAVDHTELRARLGVGFRQRVGRGLVIARLLGGATALFESRARHQAQRLGDSAGELSTSAFAVLPAANAEFGVALPVAEGWGMTLMAGPTAHWMTPDGTRLGFTARLGVQAFLGDSP